MRVNAGNSYLSIVENLINTANFDSNCKEFGEKHVLLSITIDSKISFENHLNNISKHTKQKLNDYVTTTPYMDIVQSIYAKR